MYKTIKSLLVSVMLVLMVSGCGSGGSGADEPLPLVPAVSTFKAEDPVSPTDGKIGVALNAVISANMSKDVDPASVSSAGGNYKVSQNGKIFSGAETLIGRVVNYTPSENYVSGTTVVVILSGLKDMQGNVMVPKLWSFTPGALSDTQPPTMPTNLAATAVSQTQINLTWIASTDNTAVTGYKIFRGEVQIATSSVPSYSDTGLTASTAYTYTVSAYDAAGNNSDKSATATATTSSPVLTTVNLPLVDSIFYSKGGDAQATFNKITGALSEKIAGDLTTDPAAYAQVSIRWSPLSVDMTKTYHVSFACSSTPQRKVQVQLKQDGGTYYVYASTTTVCSGIVSVDMKPSGNDPAARIVLNFGAYTGEYIIGPVKVEY